MKILALDDEYLGLEGLTSAIKQAAPDSTLNSFQDYEQALICASEWIPDVAFLDIELRITNGIEVAKKLKQINPKINIIFVTSYSDYMKEAFDLYASGYLLKPVISEKIKQELSQLRFAIPEAKKIFVHTFGDFELFYDGIPIKFKYTKTKEFFAYLIDLKGMTCSLGRIEDILWENQLQDHRAYIRNLIADMRRTLRTYNMEDIIIRSNNNISLDISKIDCDYFKFLNGDYNAHKAFNGEYMNQYSWAEKTLGTLLRK